MSHSGKVTILTYDVDDPSWFGVLVSDKDTGLVKCFVEKP